MKNLPLIGLACLGTACGIALSLPAASANLNSNDSCYNNSNCTSVYTELAIILDGSDSIEDDEFSQMLSIYEDVFSSSNFYEQILEPLDIQQIAVSVFQFGYEDSVRVAQEVGWTLLDSQTSTEAFAAQFSTIEKMGGTRSPLGNSIAEAHNGNNGSSGLIGLRNNDYEAEYLILDIGSDGFDWFSSVNWKEATRDAYADGIDAINGISVDPARVPDFSDPKLDNIVSLTNNDGSPLIVDEPDATWNNPSGTEGFLTVTGSIENYRQALANKIAQETLPADVFDPNEDYLTDDTPTTIPESSLLWGIIVIGCLGLGNKIIESK
ncbi:MAG: DUF1194 domain-containing protein [Microcystaceae cyanobacterium]